MLKDNLTSSNKIVRVSLALEKDLLSKFDKWVTKHKYKTRSEAIRDLVRANLVKQAWQENRSVVGTITIVYDHHVRELTKNLTKKQHDSQAHVLSALHVHLDKQNCLEVIVAKGNSQQIQDLADSIIGAKGVLHGELCVTALGKPQ